ncbi:MAG TPA: hypothetical protein VMS02_03230, partial [Solirubrobacteraceae bacterium]|nr:hypothetical protein [Solirubrobacteraceae bacterium]
MSIPISFVYGNIVFGERLDDAWAAFSLPCGSYQWLADEAKQTRLAALAGALEAIEADVQILRVCRAWDTDGYLTELERMRSPAALESTKRAYLQAQAERLRDCGAAEPALFLLVSLREPERDISSYVSRAAEQHPREWLRSLRRALSVRDRRLLA